MEELLGGEWVCDVHGAQLAAFSADYLGSARDALSRRREGELALRSMLASTDNCPQCRRRKGEGIPRRVTLSSPPSPDLWPGAFLRITCRRGADGFWSCTYEAGVKRKVLLLGDASTHKEELVRPAVFDEVPDAVRDLLGAKVLSRHETVPVPEEGLPFHVTFSVWDITGHRIGEKRRIRSYFRGARNVIAVADLASEKSVEELEYWLAVAERILGTTSSLVVAKESASPDPAGIAEARLADVARRHRAAVLRVPPGDAHRVQHVFGEIGKAVIQEVFGTSWWPRMYA